MNDAFRRPVQVRRAAPPALADARTLNILDFPAVRDHLAERSASELGRERALALTPSPRARQVATWQQETSEARALWETGAGLPLDGLSDVRPQIARARRGAALGGVELARVGDTLGALARLATHARAWAQTGPLLAEWAEGIGDFAALAAELSRCLGRDGEVLDRASPALAQARQQARQMESTLRDRLEEIVRAAALEGAVQEPLVTQRRDRFVLPVKSESRSLVPGLIHDQSASGATVFVEPMAVVDLGNRLRAAQSAVEHEVARILSELSDRVGERAGELQQALDAAGELDLINARARLAVDWNCQRAESLSEPALELEGARHPLLARPVPVDLPLGLAFDALVLTGPNTGGKTVCLKLAGLLACMHQAGLQLPVRAARMGVFPRVLGDAGDEQGVAQSLSTFSSHMRAVVAAVRESVPGALVLLDELGAGTDPGEGAALAMAVVEHLVQAGAKLIVTTHYSELKAFAHRTPRVRNGSMAFDPDTLAPTYRLILGVPGPSQAFAIAERLGLDPGVVERARALQRPEERQVEQLIAHLAQDQRRMGEARDRLETDAAAAAALRAQLEVSRAELEAERAAILAESRQQGAEILAQARQQADTLLREMRRLAEEAADATALGAAEQLRGELRQRQRELGEAPPPARRYHAGQPVRIRSLGREGTLCQAPADGNAIVQCGALRLNVPVSDLEPSGPPAPAPAAGRPVLVQRDVAVGGTLEHDLRGLDRWEALSRVDKALDDAVLAGLSQIRLIHGKGTGALREAIAEFLRGHPQVRAFRLGGNGEGGAGATVVELRL